MAVTEQQNVPQNQWDYSLDRQGEIISNLKQAYQQDPSKFSDWDTFSKNFNYESSERSDVDR
jgi:hypothetical protein